MSVDHCFSIKGQGTVMTGTILSGSVSLGDSVEIPTLKVSPALPFLWAPPSSGKGGGQSLCLSSCGACSSSSPALPPRWNYCSPRFPEQQQVVGRLSSRHSL